MDGFLTLQGIVKAFNGERILKGIDLSLREGEFVTILGPSGCGKTTCLRIIAGLETADAGRVFLNGSDISEIPAEKRDVNTVFQSYALFPHMTVAENIGYGLKLKKHSKSEIKKAVSEMLAVVRLEGFEKRAISTLSGGQSQRVALARALVLKPKLLLLDEPLGALDLQLRREMQLELKRIHKEMGITYIYVTHDREEAINLSDRIVVMNHGSIHQFDTPDEIYHHPKTDFVASFVDDANVFRASILDKDFVEVCHAKMPICPHRLAEGQEVLVSCRSENILIGEELVDTDFYLDAVVTDKTFTGGLLKIECQVEGCGSIVARRYGIDSRLQVGEKTRLGWKKEQTTIVEESHD